MLPSSIEGDPDKNLARQARKAARQQYRRSRSEEKLNMESGGSGDEVMEKGKPKISKISQQGRD